MGKILFDQIGEKFYELGVSKCVLFVMDKDTHNYKDGVAWNGITSISETPEGADKTDIYADNTKYASFRALETFGGTIEAYTYPDEFAECDGSADIADGVTIGQQTRKTFGLCYKTTIGNDVDGNGHGYKLHIIYGALASPSEKAYATINDSPEAITFSWEITTTPVNVTGAKPTASLVIDSTKADPTKLAALEDILYGKDGDGDAEPRLPLPDEIKTLMAKS